MPTEDDLRALARRRVEARTGFAIHLTMYVVVNAGLILIWYATGARYPWFVWPLLGWGVGIVAHGITLLLGPDSPREQRAIERELARLQNRPHQV